MSETELIALVTVCITGSLTITSIARAFLRRNESKRAIPPGAAASEERLARIENAVDAIAIEVERISEGQRFTTQLLADRVGPGRALPGAAETRAVPPGQRL
ncbi:MAG: hypothetical protein WKG32_05520 [Gemmatimonadaceae bacterium]